MQHITSNNSAVISGFEKQMEQLGLQHTISSKCYNHSKVFKNSIKVLKNLRKQYIFLSRIPDKILNFVPAAHWLIDNYHIISREKKMITSDIRNRFYKGIPTSIENHTLRLPRIYSVADNMLKLTSYHLDEASIIQLINAYQKNSPLTIQEIWALQTTLKICLIKKIHDTSKEILSSIRKKLLAEKIMNKIIYQANSEPSEILKILSNKLKTEYLSGISFLSHIMHKVSETDIDEDKFKDLIISKLNNETDISKLVHEEVQSQSILQTKISAAIISLIEISQITWANLFENLSITEEILKNDPAKVYPKMDFSSKNIYQNSIESISKKVGATEVEVAKKAVELSLKNSKSNKRDRNLHVGYYLIDEGKSLLKSALGYTSRLSDLLPSLNFKLRGTYYFLAIFVLTITTTLFLLKHILEISNLYRTVPISILFLLGLMLTLSIEVVNYIAAKLVSPKKLVSMDFTHEIPPEYTSIVVMPVILGTKKQIDKYTDSLESYYHANKYDNLYFAILGDLKDSNCKEDDTDRELLKYAEHKITCLNKKYSALAKSRFFLFLRYRKYNEKEQCWMGWERKRGKLEEFNRLILGDRDTSYSVIIGNRDMITKFKYVITIDADTELTKESAAKLIGIMAHPLNRPIIRKGKIVKGFGIIQPRIGVRISQALASIFSKTFAGQAGIDPYSYAISDIYQDIFGAAIFTGKGIYNVSVFHKIMDKRIAENSVLSHDLLESCYVKTALATDVQLMDGFPSTVAAYFKREHRWIRGDWQLLPWLFGKDSLGFLSRWKIFDNLRRSLLPIIQLATMFLAISVFKLNIYFTILLVLSSIFFSLVVSISNTCLIWLKKCTTKGHFSKLLHSLFLILKQGFFLFTLIPFKAYISFDAIVRTLYRLLISKKRMLEWQTAESVEKKIQNTLLSYYKNMWISPLSGIILLNFSLPKIFSSLSFISLLWILAPLISFLISKPYNFEKKTSLSLEKTASIRQTALKTWRYFDELFLEQDNWLVPDNYQVFPFNGSAPRTSPTNIGLQILATLAARDLGFLGISCFVERIEKIFFTLNLLERWNGHLFNWYNTKTLEVLNPRYVSTVDSGNFVACLIVLRNFLNEVKTSPVISKKQLQGLKDAAALYSNISINQIVLNQLICLKQSNNIESMPETQSKPFSPETCIYTYTQWKAILLDIKNKLRSIQPEDNKISVLKNMCSSFLKDLKLFNIKNKQDFPISINNDTNIKPFNFPAIKQLAENGSGNAKELISKIDTLIQETTKFIENTNFKPLYDESKHLFRIGFNVSSNSPDNSYYDLLASESRLGSFVAIAKGDVSKKHWFRLGRPMAFLERKATLLSWSGTMFEYLMPLLFMKNFKGSLLQESCISAVKRQIKYTKKKKIPWGISESAYYNFDRNLNYQYRAFGIPSLALRADIGKNLVITPYASMLALSILPEKVYQNIKRLKEIGAEGRYGFYEALDYISTEVKDYKKFNTVKSFMVHHQAMSLIAINNFLNENIIVKRFHSDPTIKGIEYILEETEPKGIIIENIEHRKFLFHYNRYARTKKETRTVISTKSKYPVAGLLSNGSYKLMITSNGCGISSFKDLALNNWKPILNDSGYGIFFYIRNIKTKKFWSAFYMPTMVEPKLYTVSFSPDRIEFLRKDENIESRTEIVVAPQDSVEIRRIHLANKGFETVHLEITSYFEPVIDRQENYSLHPAFSKLFLETEYIENGEILLVNRRNSRNKIEKPFIFNTVLVKGKLIGEIEYETDRSKFIGRGQSLDSPQALKTELPLSKSTGNVLDPILSIRVSLSIIAGRSATVTFIIGAAESKNAALETALKYKNEHTVDDTFKMALFDSKIEMQYLGLTCSDINAIQDMVGSLFFPSRLMRGPVDMIEKNILNQSNLWKFGISGDYPIILFRIRDITQTEELKKLITAYEYLRKNGIKLDLVILSEEEEGYFQPITKKVEELIFNRKIYSLRKNDPGIHLLRTSQMNYDEICLLIATAKVVFTEKSKLFSKRMKKLLWEETYFKIPSGFNRNNANCAENLHFSENLIYFNGFGGFSQNGKEYVIKLTNKNNTPLPWSNIMANEHFGCLVTSSGSGYTWNINSRENKLTRWSNDPVTDPSSEIIYIRDDESGKFFCPTSSPIRDKGEYIIRHGFGYTVFEHKALNIKQKLLVFTSCNDPVKIFNLNLTNCSKKTRTLSIYFYVEWVLGVKFEDSAPFIVTQVDTIENMLSAKNTYNPEFGNLIAFISSSENISSYSGDRNEFIGVGGNINNPTGLYLEELSNRVGGALDPCGVLKIKIDLTPGEKKDVIFLLGQTYNYESVRNLIKKYTDIKNVRCDLSFVQEKWEKILTQIQVKTPDTAMNLILNSWLLYQVISCRILSRSAFYQSSGAYGFRDQLQDIMAIFDTMPEFAKKHILKCCSRQFTEGDVQHWWHDESGKGVRTRISDDLLWLPFVTAAYVKSSGDKEILDIALPYIETEQLKEDEHERYIIPKISECKGTVYEHCIRAIEKSLSFGRHGLPLIGSGDWNDGMNKIGIKGSGESVWLAWFFYKVLTEFSTICKLKGDIKKEIRYRRIAVSLKNKIEEAAWDGQWYLRAFFDDGTPLGSRNNTECRIDSISQAWAVISGASDKKRGRKAMQSLKKYLINDEEKLVLLLTPPFDKSKPDPGYIAEYLTGIRENGGQYTHAAIWNIIAFSILKEGDTAYKLFRMINPINHSSNYNDAIKYKQEPYVMSADVYSTYPHAGRGGWSWYTGSAGWMYQAGIRWILGIKRERNILIIDPVIPRQWKKYSVDYRFGSSLYHITVKNPQNLSYGKVSITLDGKLIEGNRIRLIDNNKKHEAIVVIGKETVPC